MLTGLAQGGQKVARCREQFSKTLEVLIKLASLQSSFIVLDRAIKITNRRGTIVRCGVSGTMVLTVYPLVCDS